MSVSSCALIPPAYPTDTPFVYVFTAGSGLDPGRNGPVHGPDAPPLSELVLNAQVPSETTDWFAPAATTLTVPPPVFVTGSFTVADPVVVRLTLPPPAVIPFSAPLT